MPKPNVRALSNHQESKSHCLFFLSLLPSPSPKPLLLLFLSLPPFLPLHTPPKGFSVQLRSWNSLRMALNLQGSSCLCLPSASSKGMSHHLHLPFHYLKTEFLYLAWNYVHQAGHELKRNSPSSQMLRKPHFSFLKSAGYQTQSLAHARLPMSYRIASIKATYYHPASGIVAKG